MSSVARETEQYFTVVGGLVVSCAFLETALLSCASIAAHEGVISRNFRHHNIGEFIKNFSRISALRDDFPRLASKLERIEQLFEFRNDVVHGSISEIDAAKVILYRLSKAKSEELATWRSVPITVDAIVKSASEVGEISELLLKELASKIDQLKAMAGRS